MNLIYIVGMPASGKTWFGQRWAHELQYNFCDLDALIEQNEGQSIPKIFELYDENYFRNAEHKALMKTTLKQRTIVSTGGGTPMFNNNLELMLQHGIVVYLKSELIDITTRIIKNRKKRPLFLSLSDREVGLKVSNLLKNREPYYLRADYILQGKSVVPNIQNADNQKIEFFDILKKSIVNFW